VSPDAKPLGPRFVRDSSTAAIPRLGPAGDAGLPQPDLVAAIPRLRRYARILTGNSFRADDLVQDTLARAWDKRRLWQAGSDLRAWLFTIMHNVFLNQRALARRDAQCVSIDADEDGGVALQIPVRPTQQTRVELIEIMREVERLPVEQREILLLAAVEELRYEEIAAVLAIPVGTVMSRLSRARAKLRRMVAEPTSALKAMRDPKETGTAS
jgi:RNA polymerase sigma factor (sigma-70 family)